MIHDYCYFCAAKLISEIPYPGKHVNHVVTEYSPYYQRFDCNNHVNYKIYYWFDSDYFLQHFILYDKNFYVFNDYTGDAAIEFCDGGDKELEDNFLLNQTPDISYTKILMMLVFK